MASIPPSAEPADEPAPDDALVIAALRAGDEASFSRLIDQYNGALLRLAMVYVTDRATAEDVVQETWIGLLQSLPRFEGRSSLKTWIFRILMNCARSRSRKDSRSIPFSAAFTTDDHDDTDPEPRFRPGWLPGGGHWRSAPSRWQHDPEQHALSAETQAAVRQAVEDLPPHQREVITLRDIEGYGSDEVCNLLGLSDTNQRVLLHRARSRVRRARHSSRVWR